MSGHSKWSTIKRKKGSQDAARGKIFSRIAKEIIIAAREGGGEPNSNAKLRTAITKAKSENMPNDNIERAIKRGTGETEGSTYEEVIYEGYAKGGVAVMIECLTDNKNRTTPEIRYVFSKYGGSLGELGSVAYLFSRKGIIVYEITELSEETFLEYALESGAEDVKIEGGMCEVITPPELFSDLIQTMEEKHCKPLQADIIRIPTNYVEHNAETAEKILMLIEKIEEIDDVQSVSHNLALMCARERT